MEKRGNIDIHEKQIDISQCLKIPYFHHSHQDPSSHHGKFLHRRLASARSHDESPRHIDDAYLYLQCCIFAARTPKGRKHTSSKAFRDDNCGFKLQIRCPNGRTLTPEVYYGVEVPSLTYGSSMLNDSDDRHFGV